MAKNCINIYNNTSGAVMLCVRLENANSTFLLNRIL